MVAPANDATPGLEERIVDGTGLGRQHSGPTSISASAGDTEGSVAKEEAVARDWSRSLFQSAEAGSTVRSPFTVTSVAQTHLTPVTTATATAVAVVEVVVVETAGLFVFCLLAFVVVLCVCFLRGGGGGWGGL